MAGRAPRNRTTRGVETRGGGKTNSPTRKNDESTSRGDADPESTFEGSFVQQMMEGGGDGRLGEDLLDIENLANEEYLVPPPPPQHLPNEPQLNSDDEGPIVNLHVLLTISKFSDGPAADDYGDTGKVRLCSDILDTLWHRAEVSINQVKNESYLSSLKISFYRWNCKLIRQSSAILKITSLPAFN